MSAIWSQGRVAPSTSLDTDARSDTRKKRDSHKRNTKRRLVDLLVEGGFAEVAGKVAACNSNYFALACRNGHLAQILPAFRCRNRLCPYCAAERQRRAYTKLLPIVENFARAQPRARAVLITLTIRSSFDPLRTQDHDFKTAFRRFRRMKRWKGRIRGAVCGYEFTLTPAGWHYHAHILAFREAWYDQAELAEDWQKATRAKGGIVDIRAVSGFADGLRDVLQYCFKPIDLEKWTANEVQQFQSMSKIKLAECFGELRGLRSDHDEFDGPLAAEELFVGCPCPECGEPLHKVKLSWRELDNYAPIPKDWFVKARAGPELVH